MRTLSHAIDMMLSKLHINGKFNILKTSYHSINVWIPFNMHMVHNLSGQKNNETISTFQKLQNYCALWKINFKNVITVYKLSIQRMKNTEISWHPNKSFSKENCHPTKLSFSLPNPAQPQTQCLFQLFLLLFMPNTSTTTTAL